MTGDFDRPISRWVYRLGASFVGVLYLLGTLGRAHQKLFWHDEIFTVVLAQLGPAALWGALRTATDLNPPAFYLATRVAEMIFGQGLIGSRMPAVMGVLAAALCAGLFVRRRYGPFAGLVTILLFLATDAYLYAYEARPYGLVLGLAGAALVCWQSTLATSPVRHAGAVAGLWASLTTAIACHYYAVLLLLPIAAAEVSRFLRRRQPRWPVWIGTGGAIAPMLVCWPLIASAREYSAGFFAPPSLGAGRDSGSPATPGVRDCGRVDARARGPLLPALDAGIQHSRHDNHRTLRSRQPCAARNGHRVARLGGSASSAVCTMARASKPGSARHVPDARGGERR
jgi:hypothetical protein